MSHDQSRPETPLKVLFENERVRVLEVRTPTGGVIGEHTHSSPYLVYPFSASRLRFNRLDGTAQEVQLEAGQVQWFPAEAHTVENTGQTEDHALVIEIKG